MWDHIARHFRSLTYHYRKKHVSIKDIAFREVYRELIKRIIQSHLSRAPLVLKTDLWNEGVERNRNLASFVRHVSPEAEVVGLDISRTVCEYAKEEKDYSIEIVRSTLLAPPFWKKFDLIIDVSTVDHIPERLRERWISTESSFLKENGILLISFDCKLNLFCEMYHRFFTRKLYPEWTLTPASVRRQIVRNGFQVLDEHAVFLLGLFLGTHRPWFPLARLFNHEGFIEVLKSVELSPYSRLLSFLAPQYVLVARKTVEDQ
jgi:hypothetical protein